MGRGIDLPEIPVGQYKKGIERIEEIQVHVIGKILYVQSPSGIVGL